MSAVDDRIIGQSAPNQKNIAQTMHREWLDRRRAQDSAQRGLIDLNRLQAKYQSNYKSSNDKWVSS
jgi:hypothetical protein